MKFGKQGKGTSTIVAIVLVVVALILVAVAVFSPSKTSDVTTPTGRVVDLQFVNHIQAGMPEQDVFVAGENEGEVMRIEADGVAMYNDENVYRTSEMVEHDPFKLGDSPLGPFPQGEMLDLTMGEWLEASASGTYSVEGDSARMIISAQDLVPNGVYTVWCSRVTVPPNFGIMDYPCGASDGSENTLNVDADGNGALSLELDEPLPETTEETVTLIALAYHSDGNTYGAHPGEFGLNSHVQLFFIVPPAEA